MFSRDEVFYALSQIRALGLKGTEAEAARQLRLIRPNASCEAMDDGILMVCRAYASQEFHAARAARTEQRVRNHAANYLWDAYCTHGHNTRAKAYPLAIQNLYDAANVPEWEHGPDHSELADAAWLLECSKIFGSL